MHRHRPWLACRAFGRHRLLALAALMLMVAGSLLPTRALAHARGPYPTQAEAEKRARELGWQGVHRHNCLLNTCDAAAQDSGGSLGCTTNN